MVTVFVLQHVARADAPDEDVKLIGVYTTRQAADAAVARLSALPGFRDFKNGFHIAEYFLDRDHWEEGFVSSDDA